MVVQYYGSYQIYNNNQWTQARFNSFIKSALRSASQRWPPKYAVLKEAYVGTFTNPASGRQAKFYKCNVCKEDFVAKNIEVNHIVPVVPITGFDSWDNLIARLFCEADGLEVVCKICHKRITKEENAHRRTTE